MIVPEGARLELRAIDEFMHEPEAAANYNESMYFNAFDHVAGCGLWVRIGNRPNEGHAEVTCCIYLPDGRVGFMYAKPEISDNTALAAAGMAFEVVRPFEQFRVRFRGQVLLLDDPHAMIDPGRAYKTNSKVACEIDLLVDGISPMHGGEIVSPDGSAWTLDPETAVFRGHTEQHTHSSGTIAIGDVQIALNGFGLRDKSWGPRFWQSFYWYRWIPVTFGPDFGLLLALMGQRDGPPVVSGHVYADGKLDPLAGADLAVDWDESDYPRRFRVDLKTDRSTYQLNGEILALLPLRNRREQPGGGLIVSRITEAMTRYTCGGHVGLGISEFLDLMIDERPVSLTG